MPNSTGSFLLAVGAAVVSAGLLSTPATAADAGPTTGRDASTVLAACSQYPVHRTSSRAEILARSQSWLAEHVPYSQAACHKNEYGQYRTDCSGYVSMAWGARRSYTTRDMHEISHEIAHAQLRPGDALLDAGRHMALFVRWDDEARTTPVVREHTGPNGTPAQERAWSADRAAQYTAIRYDHLVD